MTVLYPKLCYKVVCYKETALFTHLWASTRENLSSGFANNKGADRSAHLSRLMGHLPAHLRRLISTFVIPFLEGIVQLFSIGYCKLHEWGGGVLMFIQFEFFHFS